jgi:translation elongation factor EF-G
MQLTTARLKQIIKEELEAIVNDTEETEEELSEGLLNEFTGMDAAQAILAVAGGAAAPMLLQALVNMARSVAGKPEENDIKKAIDAIKEKMGMNEAKKKAALAKQKMPAKRGSTGTFGTKNPQADQRFQKAGAVKKSK